MKLGAYSCFIRGLDRMKSAVALLQAIAMLQTTAILKRALTSTSWGCGSSGSLVGQQAARRARRVEIVLRPFVTISVALSRALPHVRPIGLQTDAEPRATTSE